MEDPSTEDLRRENMENVHTIKCVASVAFDKKKKKFDYSNFQEGSFECGDAFFTMMKQ